MRLATGDRRGGVEMLRLALARDGENKRALATLASVHLEQRDWPGAAVCQHSLARLAQEGAEQRALYLAAAEVWEKHARLPTRAALVLEEAHERSPRDVAILHRLVALAKTLGDWEKLARSLRWLAELEPEPAQRAKQLYASAGVVHEKIGDRPRAALLYEEALDLDPARLEAFERLVRAWTEEHDWEKLELAYTRMIGRIRQGADAKLLHALYHQLGLLLRDRIGDMPRALAAFRLARSARPEEEEDQRIVVELLLLMGEIDGAVAEMRNAVRAAPQDPASYRKLYDVHLRRGAHDKAWCAANVLVHLGAADEVQRRFVDDFPPVALEEARGTLASCAWKSHLLAERLDERLTAIFRFFVPAVVRARMGRVPAGSRMRWLGAQVSETESAAAERLVRMVRIRRRSSRAAAAAAPRAPPPAGALRPGPHAHARALRVDSRGRGPPAGAPRLPRRPPPRRASARARRARPLSHCDGAQGSAQVSPSCRDCDALRPPHDPHEAAVLAALEAHELEGLRAAVSTIVGTPSQPDVARWLRLANLSASRAGLLLCGDFDLAWRSMQGEPRSPSGLAPGDWRKEMASFAVSDGYHELHDAIAVNVETRC